MLLPGGAIFFGMFFQSVAAWRALFLLQESEDYIELARAKGYQELQETMGFPQGHAWNNQEGNSFLVSPSKLPIYLPATGEQPGFSVNKKGVPFALLKVDNLLYQVKLGNYLGLNYGRVTQISETEVTLREIVQDALGEWIERIATLHLQEKAK